MKLKIALAFAVLLLASAAHADSSDGTLLISGTAQLGTETVTASYEVSNGTLVDGSVNVFVVGPGQVSFETDNPTMSGACGEDLNLYNGTELLQITFYEASDCRDHQGISVGDLGLFYMTCPAGFCGPTGYDNFGQGFAEVTDPIATPEPSIWLLLLAGMAVLLVRKQNESSRLHSRN